MEQLLAAPSDGPFRVRSSRGSRHPGNSQGRSEGEQEGKFSSDMRTFIFPNIACLGRSGRNSTRRQRVVFFYCSLREIKVRIKKGEYTAQEETKMMMT